VWDAAVCNKIGIYLGKVHYIRILEVVDAYSEMYAE